MPPKPKVWTDVEREEAQALAEELLCKRTLPSVIVRAIMKTYVVNDDTARRVLKAADESMKTALGERAKYRRSQLLAGLDRLYERACDTPGIAGIREAARIADLIANVEGHKRPLKVEVSDATTADGLFANRSDEECEYYSQNGHFPDEAPGSTGEQPTEGVKQFPLH